MITPEQMQELAEEAAERAAAKKREPYVPFDSEEVRRMTWTRRTPNFGTYRPKGWTLVGAWLVDASGFGSEHEPALTARAFCDKAATLADERIDYGFALIEEGQFQVLVGIFVPDRHLPAWQASDRQPGFVGVRSGAAESMKRDADDAAHQLARTTSRRGRG